ncbi:MAG: hypothetical protein MR420_00520 [Spirochaetia bacterium]|nr:hypothetical protein [Spirochaetia bacterium]
MFKEMSYAQTNPASKEVLNYRQAKFCIHHLRIMKKSVII